MSKNMNISQELLQSIFYREAKTLHLSEFSVIINKDGPENFRQRINIDDCLTKFRRFANKEGFVLDGSLGFSDHLLLQPTINACEKIYKKNYVKA